MWIRVASGMESMLLVAISDGRSVDKGRGKKRNIIVLLCREAHNCRKKRFQDFMAFLALMPCKGMVMRDTLYI